MCTCTVLLLESGKARIYFCLENIWVGKHSVVYIVVQVVYSIQHPLHTVHTLIVVRLVVRFD